MMIPFSYISGSESTSEKLLADWPGRVSLGEGQVAARQEQDAL
jgi:hypothetical protein